MATTTNFGWETPDDTDLVKDGAAAMRTLGNSIDTSFVDLKGGTTGQVLAKASATDLDFSWVAQDDSNAIQNAIVDAKGDLIGATAADTPARLAVGTNGQVLTADSTAATGIKWATPATATSGLTLITTSSPSAASTVSINNCFSSTYQSYQIHYNLNSTAVSSLNVRLRASGTDATTNYIVQTFTVRAGVTAPSRDAVGGKFIVGAVRTSGRSYGICNISNPFAADETSTFSQAQDPETAAALDFRACAHTTATSYDGFTFYTDSGTFTGSIRVYGVQN